MNCLEFRRRMLEDPLRSEPELLEHEAACSDCAPFAQDIREQEAQLRELLNAPEPPPNLSDQVELAIQLQQRNRPRRQAWYAAAASVLLIVSATFASLVNESWERGNMALAQSVLNHIDDEAHHLRESGPVSKQRVKLVFARFGARLNQDVGQINFAAECLMRNRNGVHLVLPGKNGPITAFFMPGEMVEQSMPVQSARFEGHITPAAWGSVAVVGERGEDLAGLGETLASAVSWPQGVLVGDRARVAAPLVAQQ